MIRKLFAALFAVLGLCTAYAAVYIGMNCTDREPQLLTPPSAAENAVVSMMEAVCAGDYAQASAQMLGNPSLGADREASDTVGVLIWDAFQKSLSYELVGECYTNGSGLAQDLTVTCLDISSVTENLRARSQALLEQRVEEAEVLSDIYDEKNEYREDFVMDVLYDAAEDALAEDGREKTVELTVKLTYSDGSWWVVLDSALLNAISGGIA